jgi:YNFM family putative membrane transporter
MFTGYILFFLVLVAMLVPHTGLLFILLFPFCGAMFLVHTVATAVVNRKAEQYRSLASGFYVSSYYSGGVAGMYIPGLIFERYGWNSMVAGMVVVAMVGIVILSVFFAATRRD